MRITILLIKTYRNSATSTFIAPERVLPEVAQIIFNIRETPSLEIAFSASTTLDVAVLEKPTNFTARGIKFWVSKASTALVCTYISLVRTILR